METIGPYKRGKIYTYRTRVRNDRFPSADFCTMQQRCVQIRAQADPRPPIDPLPIRSLRDV